MRRARCKLGAHNDQLLRGGRSVRCTECGDVFPCRHACDHFDCLAERAEPGSIIADELGFARRSS